MFFRADTKEVVYKINPKAPNTTENLELYKMMGKVIGKALFEKMTIPTTLDRFLLKQLIGAEFTLEDLKSSDKEV